MAGVSPRSLPGHRHTPPSPPSAHASFLPLWSQWGGPSCDLACLWVACCLCAWPLPGLQPIPQVVGPPLPSWHTWQLFCEGHAYTSPNEREAGFGVQRPLGPAGWEASLSSGPCACCPALRVVLLPWAPPRRAVGLAVAASRSWDAHVLLWRRASGPELGARSGALVPPLQGAEAGV